MFETDPDIYCLCLFGRFLEDYAHRRRVSRAFEHVCCLESDEEASGCQIQSILIFNSLDSGVRDSSIVLLCLFASAR